ncbi:MAG TPA: response regulator [Blastocatellia bacterium]|nr:response regulator [Blastocatellia bacterium]
MQEHQKRILVADDDNFTRETLRIVLTKAGFEVSTAQDGETALSMTKEERPNLVVTDGLLPKLHGFLVCKAIKELDDPPRVIILTGVYTKPTYKWELIKEYGADVVLSKPFVPDDLVACITKQLQIARDLDAQVTGAAQPDDHPPVVVMEERAFAFAAPGEVVH